MLFKAEQAATRGQGQADQNWADSNRAWNQLSRQYEREDVTRKLSEARDREAFYRGVLTYYNAQLEWFADLEAVMGANRGDTTTADGTFEVSERDRDFYQEVQTRKTAVRERLLSVQEQLGEVETQLSDLQFNEFKQESRYAREDEAFADEDITRQTGWVTAVQGEIDTIDQRLESYRNDAGEYLSEADGGPSQEVLQAITGERESLVSERDRY